MAQLFDGFDTNPDFFLAGHIHFKLGNYNAALSAYITHAREIGLPCKQPETEQPAHPLRLSIEAAMFALHIEELVF